MISGNVLLTLEDLKTPEGVNQLNRMIEKLFKTVEEDAYRYAMMLTID